MKQFSVCTSVYKNDRSEFVGEALDSMLEHQTVKPDEIVIVQDGPVPYETSKLLLRYKDKFGEKLNIIKLTENKGLGNALMLGVENAKYDIIARMDSDDICIKDRFEKQLAYLEAHQECDIVGGQITEFIDSHENIVGKREVPCSNEEIYKYMRSRCALNHPTVMFKKESVLKAGNYKDWFWNEDYYMWVRMMEQGCVFANLPDVLVNMRSGLEQYNRRGGWKYFKSEKGIQEYMLNKGLITKALYYRNVFIRWLVQIAMPCSCRGWAYRTFFR